MSSATSVTGWLVLCSKSSANLVRVRLRVRVRVRVRG